MLFLSDPAKLLVNPLENQGLTSKLRVLLYQSDGLCTSRHQTECKRFDEPINNRIFSTSLSARTFAECQM